MWLGRSLFYFCMVKTVVQLLVNEAKNASPCNGFCKMALTSFKCSEAEGKECKDF